MKRSAADHRQTRAPWHPAASRVCTASAFFPVASVLLAIVQKATHYHGSKSYRRHRSAQAGRMCQKIVLCQLFHPRVEELQRSQVMMEADVAPQTRTGFTLSYRAQHSVVSCRVISSRSSAIPSCIAEELLFVIEGRTDFMPDHNTSQPRRCAPQRLPGCLTHYP